MFGFHRAQGVNAPDRRQRLARTARPRELVSYGRTPAAGICRALRRVKVAECANAVSCSSAAIFISPARPQLGSVARSEKPGQPEKLGREMGATAPYA
jgi:hypothetical protein